jgi:hypothetical protein
MQGYLEVGVLCIAMQMRVSLDPELEELLTLLCSTNQFIENPQFVSVSALLAFAEDEQAQSFEGILLLERANVMVWNAFSIAPGGRRPAGTTRI